MLAGAAAFGLALTSVAAVAEPMRGWGRHGDEMEILAGVNLTDAQKSQIHAIEHDSWSHQRASFEQLRAIHGQLQAGVLAGESAAQLAPLLSQAEAIRTAMDQQHLATVLQVRGTLTTAQLSQAATNLAKLTSLHEQERAMMAPPADATP
jgi:Spy/CpxP family protein refolding chaperone